jgi:DNA-binding CsgD family transcriptional regulator
VDLTGARTRDERKRPDRDRVCERNHAVFLLGLSMYLCMLRPPFLGSLLVGLPSDVTAMRFSYFLGIFLFGLMLAMFPVAGASRGADSLRGVGACVGANVVGITAVATMQFAPLQFNAIALSAVAGICIGFVALSWGWVSALGRMSAHDAIVSCLVAFVLSHLFGLMDFLPRYLASTTSVCYPIFSFLFLSFSESEGALDSESVQLRRLQSHAASSAEDNRAAIAALLLIVMVVLGSSFLRSMYCQSSGGYTPSDKVLSIYTASAVTGILFAVATMRRRSSPRDIMLAGLLSSVLFSVLCIMYGLGWEAVSVPFITGLCSTLQAYLLGVVAALPLGRGAHAKARAGSFCVLFSASSSITYSIIPGVIALGGTLPEQYRLAVVSCGELFALVGIIAALLMLLGFSHARAFASLDIPAESDGRTLRGAQPLAPGAGGQTGGDALGGFMANGGAEPSLRENVDSYRMAVDRATAEYGLTERERETAALISRGFTAKRVAEELSITTGTVQSYCKSIYRKMGIHKKDELIDAVEAQRRLI